MEAQPGDPPLGSGPSTDAGTASRRWRHPSTGIAVVVAAQAVVTIVSLQRTFFFGDDYTNFQVAREMGLSVAYLKRSLFGHLEPGYRFGNWFMLNVLGASHAACLTVEVLGLAVSTVVVARLLRLLLGGTGPWFFVLLVGYAFAVSLVPSTMWWSASLNALPATIFAVLTLDAAVRWWLDGSRRQLVIAVVAFVIGMTFYEKITYVPFVAGLVLIGWYQSGSLRDRLVELVRRGWPLIIGFGVPLMAYWAAFASLHYSREIPQRATSGQLLHYLSYAWFEGLVPLLLGLATPTHRIGSPVTTAVLSSLVFVAVVVASLRRRPWAWRGWALLVVVFAINGAIVGLARAGADGAAYGRETKYFGDYAWLVVVCLALVVTPGRDPELRAPGRRRAHHRVIRIAPAPWSSGTSLAVAGVLALVWSVNTVTSYAMLVHRAPSKAARQFESALTASWDGWRARDPQARMVDVNVPIGIEAPQFYPYSLLSRSAGHYLDAPRYGTSAPALVASQRGVFVPAQELPTAATAVAAGARASGSLRIGSGPGLGCLSGGASGGVATFALDRPLPAGEWILRIGVGEQSGNASTYVLVETPDGPHEGRNLVINHAGFTPFDLTAHGLTVVALAPWTGISTVALQLHGHARACITTMTLVASPT